MQNKDLCAVQHPSFKNLIAPGQCAWEPPPPSILRTWFLTFFLGFWCLQNSPLCIMGELAGGGPAALAVSASDRWHATPNTWHVTRDIWMLTHEFSLFFFSSYIFCPFLSVLLSVLLYIYIYIYLVYLWTYKILLCNNTDNHSCKKYSKTLHIY